MSAPNDFLHKLKNGIGPGIITGASDDDPSGILTYLQAGVVLGFKSLWTALLTLPLMYGVQEMCGRIGLTTGKGLVRLIREKYGSKILYPIVALTTAAIVLNIAADLLAMGVVLEGLTKTSRLAWMPIISALILYATIFLSYKRLASLLKWFTFSLFFYIVTAFYLRIDWLHAISATLTPSFAWQTENILILSAILGTTISPYLFFWQASEEVEEKEFKHIKNITVTKTELTLMRTDTFWGMLFSNLTMWFIMAGATSLGSLYGITHIESFDQAALVLRPLLGESAYLIFSLGILGTGFLTIPVLAGNIGYAIAEIFDWPEGMNKTFREAPGFYLAIASTTVVALAFGVSGFDPIKLLIYSAVFYTLITPPILFIILKIANSRTIMKHSTNNFFSNTLGVLTFILMTACALAYLSSFLYS